MIFSEKSEKTGLFLLQFELIEGFPHDNSGTNRHIDGVFCAFLWQLNGTFAIGQGLIADAFHLVAQDISAAWLKSEGLKGDAVFHLLYCIYVVSFVFQCLTGFRCG